MLTAPAPAHWPEKLCNDNSGRHVASPLRDAISWHSALVRHAREGSPAATMNRAGASALPRTAHRTTVSADATGRHGHDDTRRAGGPPRRRRAALVPHISLRSGET